MGYIAEPHALRTSKGNKFQSELRKHGFYVRAIFNTPEKILLPETSIQPVILLVGKEPVKKLFIAELFSPKQTREVIQNFISRKDTNKLFGGLFVNDKDFRSFSQFKNLKQIEKLETQYKEYDR